MMSPLNPAQIPLSAEQLHAVADLSGPVRIVAGAGTGKTTVIAERFARLVANGEDPSRILVLTFTDRAANQMRERITTRIGFDAPLNVGTFHALALGWLREDGTRVGVPMGFTILNGPERWIVMRELLWELADPSLIETERPDELVSPLLRLLEKMKQELVSNQRLHEWLRTAPPTDRAKQLRAAARLFDAYEAHCRAHRQFDFDDLILNTVRLFESRPEITAGYRRRFPTLMVDEYQDTNLAQERLVELLTGNPANVCVVGDDDQSIYRFRGASTASLDRFTSIFPAAATYLLGQNRRNSGNVVEAARSLIEHNPTRFAKHIEANNPPSHPVRVIEFEDGQAEAGGLAGEILELLRSGVPLEEIAILTRTRAILKPVLEELARAEIPCQVWGAQGFYDQPEIRDLIAYLRCINRPHDSIALARLLLRPPLELEPDLALSLAVATEQRPLGIVGDWDHFASPALDAWLSIMTDLITLKGELGVDDLFFELLTRTGYLDGVPGLGPARSQVVANVTRFSEILADFCSNTNDHRLERFMAHLDLVLLSGLDDSLARPEGKEAAVQVMTIHQSKGLEFDAVLIPSVVEQRMPHLGRGDGPELPSGLVAAGRSDAPSKEDHLAEERRLLYVAMTRARERLILTWARRYQGIKRWAPSRFLAEIAVDGAVSSEVVAGSRRSTGANVSDIDGRPPDPVRPQLVPPSDAPIVLSFSAISSYRECPRQFWFRYRHRLHAPPTPEAQFGTAVHEVLREAAERRSLDQEITPQFLSELNRQVWDTQELADGRRRRAFEALAGRELESYRRGGGFDSPPFAVEHQFEIQIDAWTLRGVIDRIDRPLQAGGAWRLIDYKTGAPKPKSNFRTHLQLALYALGARSEFGFEQMDLQVAYLRDGKTSTVEATEDLMEEARRIGAEVAGGVAAGQFSARPQVRRCQLCAYRLSCPDGW